MIILRGQGSGPYSSEKIAEIFIAADLIAEHHHVDEAADQAFHTRMVAPRRRTADDQIFLPAVAVEQDLVGRKQRHEQCDAFFLAECLQGIEEFSRNDSDVHRAAKVLNARPRMVGGQLKNGGGSSQSFLVKRKLIFKLAFGHAIALPQRIVGILDGQLRQRYLFLSGECGVERLDFTHEHTARPAIGRDVVHDQNQGVVAC